MNYLIPITIYRNTGITLTFPLSACGSESSSQRLRLGVELEERDRRDGDGDPAAEDDAERAAIPRSNPADFTTNITSRYWPVRPGS